MKPTKPLSLLLLSLFSFIFSACAGLNSSVRPPVNFGTVEPGTAVMLRGEKQPLIGNPIKIGDMLPSAALISSDNLTEVDLSKVRGKVLFLSIVPSIDTKVCEAQTHYLGEEGDRLSPRVERITISRDTPFAQRRFAEEAKLTDIHFLSDYKEGAFGKSLGLLQEKSRLLARAVILIDGQGVVRYIQVVPELSNLPGMERAFSRASELVHKLAD